MHLTSKYTNIHQLTFLLAYLILGRRVRQHDFSFNRGDEYEAQQKWNLGDDAAVTHCN